SRPPRGQLGLDRHRWPAGRSLHLAAARRRAEDPGERRHHRLHRVRRAARAPARQAGAQRRHDRQGVGVDIVGALMTRHWTLAALVLATSLGSAGAQDERNRPLPGTRAAAAAPPATGTPVVEYDPWQGFNRKIFPFNDTLDEWVLEPVAKGWDYVTPKPVERGLSNFFGNLHFPIDLVNNLLQGKGIEGAKALGRFTVNTTLGAAGFLDP